MSIKLPLQDSFAFLCNFVGTLRDGLQIVAEGATENEQAIEDLRRDIIAGTVSPGQGGA